MGEISYSKKYIYIFLFFFISGIDSLVINDVKEITIEKSKSGNPMLGFDQNGNILYGGDPSILVDDDTVYAYVGHDTSTRENYYMPDWQCYSSNNMKDWKYEGEILSSTEISWANDQYSSWASQVIKYNGKYYLYYCTEARVVLVVENQSV